VDLIRLRRLCTSGALGAGFLWLIVAWILLSTELVRTNSGPYAGSLCVFGGGGGDTPRLAKKLAPTFDQLDLVHLPDHQFRLPAVTILYALIIGYPNERGWRFLERWIRPR
jgi:hypothetical protein